MDPPAAKGNPKKKMRKSKLARYRCVGRWAAYCSAPPLAGEGGGVVVAGGERGCRIGTRKREKTAGNMGGGGQGYSFLLLVSVVVVAVVVAVVIVFVGGCCCCCCCCCWCVG